MVEDEKPPKQHGLFDPVKAEAAREEAIARVDAHVAPVWRAMALEAIRITARALPLFTADDVWRQLGSPREPRALGPVFRQAEGLGYCAATNEWRLSMRVSRHRAPIRVWRSCLRQGG